MIDIHSHILPKIDDGARSLNEALKMAAIATADGIEQMVCTPHLFNGLSRDPEFAEIEDRVGALQNAIGNGGLKVLPGSEVRASRKIVKQVDTNLVTKINGKIYMLVELPTPSVPRGIQSLFKQLLNQGVNPILVHPERNLEIQRRPSIAADLVTRGVLIQVTAMSVTGQFGPAAKICAESLLKHKCVHFLATDTHRPEKRAPILSRGRDAAAAIIGVDAARRLVEENPLAVVTGAPIVPDPVIPYEEAVRSTNSSFFRAGCCAGSFSYCKPVRRRAQLVELSEPPNRQPKRYADSGDRVAMAAVLDDFVLEVEIKVGLRGGYRWGNDGD